MIAYYGRAEIDAAKKVEEERAKRVEHLGQVGLRRIMQQGLAKGWSAWHEMWEEKARQQRLLKGAAARLAKPKLAAAVTHWVNSWKVAEGKSAEMSKRAAFADEVTRPLTTRTPWEPIGPRRIASRLWDTPP